MHLRRNRDRAARASRTTGWTSYTDDVDILTLFGVVWVSLMLVA
jgi:hypothetical protein